MDDPRHIILAACVSDEVIGCYSLIKSGIITDVVYFEEMKPDDPRIEEAKTAANKFGYNASFVGYAFPVSDEDQLYIPCRYDKHPERKNISLKYRGFENVKFYSIDKTFKNLLLDEILQKQKKEDLDIVFASQKDAWSNDSKYYLFETVLDTDYLIRSYIKFNCGHIEFSVSFEMSALDYDLVREYIVEKLTGINLDDPVEVGKKLMKDLESQHDTDFTVEIDNTRDGQKFVIS